LPHLVAVLQFGGKDIRRLPEKSRTNNRQTTLPG